MASCARGLVAALAQVDEQIPRRDAVAAQRVGHHLEVARLEAGALQRGTNVLRHLAALYFQRGNVHRDEQFPVATAMPFGRLEACGLDDPLADRQDRACRLGG